MLSSTTSWAIYRIKLNELYSVILFVCLCASVCFSMYVCMLVCMHVCVHACVCVSVCIQLYVQMCVLNHYSKCSKWFVYVCNPLVIVGHEPY